MQRLARAAFLCIVTLFSVALTHTNGAFAGSQAFASIAGTWYYHGFSLSVGADGQAVAQFRIYQWCSDLSSPAPCDSMIGNEFESGGLAMLRFTSIGSEEADASIIMSSDPSVFSPGRAYTLMFLPGGVAQLSGPQGPMLVLCGPQLDLSQFQTPPCGA